MNKIEGYNRNITGGKRPHRKITKFGKYFGNLGHRLTAETEALVEYQKRVGQYQETN